MMTIYQLYLRKRYTFFETVAEQYFKMYPLKVLIVTKNVICYQGTYRTYL